MELEKRTLNFWHGSRRWEGSPELRPHKGSRSYCGPGLYSTTDLTVAQKYGSPVLLTVSDDITFLEDVRLPIGEVLEGLSSLGRVKSKSKIIEDLQELSDRQIKEGIPAVALLNLCVNYEAIAGNVGVALAEFYIDKGIDASLANSKHGEDWVAFYNMKKITSSIKMKSSQAYEIGDFPTIKEQRRILDETIKIIVPDEETIEVVRKRGMKR